MDVLTASMSEQPFEYDPETNTFVASSNGTAECNLLVGYGFDGCDMLIGEEGRASWEVLTGRAFRGGEDGTYAIVSQIGSIIRIETDHAGHMPVFFYGDGRVAAASNSVIRLIKHLRYAGVPVRPNPAEIVARGTDFFPLHQLKSFATAAAGVSMLPTGCRLYVEAGNCRIERLPRPTVTDYRSDLRSCIAI